MKRTPRWRICRFRRRRASPLDSFTSWHWEFGIFPSTSTVGRLRQVEKVAARSSPMDEMRVVQCGRGVFRSLDFGRSSAFGWHKSLPHATVQTQDSANYPGLIRCQAGSSSARQAQARAPAASCCERSQVQALFLYACWSLRNRRKLYRPPFHATSAFFHRLQRGVRKDQQRR